MTTEEIVGRLIARYGRPDTARLSLSSPLAEVGVDGLALAHIVVYLEAHFDIVVPSLEADDWTTGTTIVATVQRLLAEHHRQAS
jgi:acyl carrier protein